MKVIECSKIVSTELVEESIIKGVEYLEYSPKKAFLGITIKKEVKAGFYVRSFFSNKKRLLTEKELSEKFIIRDKSLYSKAYVRIRTVDGGKHIKEFRSYSEASNFVNLRRYQSQQNENIVI